MTEVTCPGCGLAIILDDADLPEDWDVMCAFCGTITQRLRLMLPGAGPS